MMPQNDLNVCFFLFSSCNMYLLEYQRTQEQHSQRSLSIQDILLNDNEDDKIGSFSSYKQKTRLCLRLKKTFFR